MQMKHNDKVKKRYYQEQIQQQLSGYKEETKRLKKEKLNRKKNRRKTNVYY